MKRTIIWALCMMLIASSLPIYASTETAEQRVYQWMEQGLPSPNVENTPFSYGRIPTKSTWLVQDTFTGTKAQLKPISDYFLAQPWYYWVGQNLEGTRTRSLTTVFDYRFGETFSEPRNIAGSLASIQGLTDSNGVQLGPKATLNDVLSSPQVAPEILKAVQAAFPDITGDEWYISTVGWAVMMGIIGGRPGPDGDSLIFAGDAEVTRIEWMIMLNRLGGLWAYDIDMKDPLFNQNSDDGVVPTSAWFVKDYNLAVGLGNQGDLSGLYTFEELSKPVSRAEAAYIYDKVRVGLNHATRYAFEQYQERKSAFPDIALLNSEPIMRTSLLTGEQVPQLSMLDYLQELSMEQRLEAARKGTMSFPYPLFDAITNLNLNQIMNGYTDGNLYPFETLTRAQALSLLFKACSLYPNTFADSYDG